MKLIIAIVRPEKLEAVQNALDAKEIHLMTVSNVHGCGSQKGYSEQFRGGKIPIRLLPKIKIEVAVNENYVKPAIDAILTAAKSDTPKIGDGKIFVVSLEEVYRIRTGETGSVAIGP